MNYITITLHHRRKQRKSWRSQAMSYVQATIYLTPNGRIHSSHPTSQQRHIESCFSRRRNLIAARQEYKHILAGTETLQQQKKRIEKCFNRIKNLTG